MNLFPSISIIIPTHNRVHSLKRLLNGLALQTYPMHLMQVIVAVDGCTDDTTNMLQQFEAPFTLQYIELPGKGAATARNEGAALATHALLLFLDDDIDPSNELVGAHVHLQQNEHTVVIGYLPFAVPAKNGFFKLNLRSWWEAKFHAMRQPGYRYSYEDLLSGNFSLPAALFKKAQGFDTTLSCREDYELGIRLIKHGAQFIFSEKAWGYHRDEATDLHRSLKRKRQEGRADVQFWRKHPDVITPLQDAYANHHYTFLRSKVLFFVVHSPKLTDVAAYALERMMHVLEKLRLRSEWERLNYKLHVYWYTRGLLGELHSGKNLEGYLRYVPIQDAQNEELEINLKKGIAAAEQLLDEIRPASVCILYGKQFVGVVPYKPGAERLCGKHLRQLLATGLSAALLQALALEQLQKKPVANHQALVEQ